MAKHRFSLSPKAVLRRVVARPAGRMAALLACLVLLSGCAEGDGPQRNGDAMPQAVVPATPVPAGTGQERPRTVLVLGDSLAAAYNLAPEQGWVALLDARLAAEGLPYRMVNASVSGETTAGGATRIDDALVQHRPALVVLGLGANDGLRGLPLSDTRRHLVRMVDAAHRANARVLIIGMRLPPNYGPEYTADFFALFGEVADEHDTAHLPFLLEPIALDDGAFQPDRLHPTAEAQPRIAEHVWPALRPLLSER